MLVSLQDIEKVQKSVELRRHTFQGMAQQGTSKRSPSIKHTKSLDIF